MKSTLLAITLLCLSASSAIAQSSVTLYGAVDNGINYINNKSGHSTVALADGISKSNRFGLLGREDLGSGVSAFFKLESSFSLNSGALSDGLLFEHESYVGLKDTDIGQLRLGRQYDFTNDLYRYLPCLYCGIYIVGNADFDRLSGEELNNTIKFISRDFSGLTVGGMYAFGSGSSGTTNFGRAYSLIASYQNGGFSTTAVVTDINGAITHAGHLGTLSFLGMKNNAPNANVDSQRIIALGASYDFGKLTAATLYTNSRLTLHEQFSTDQNLRVGADYHIRSDVMISAAGIVEKLEDSRWYSADAGISYSLSKLTNVYLVGLFQRASGPGTVASIATLGLSSTRSQVVGRVGMTHTF